MRADSYALITALETHSRSSFHRRDILGTLLFAERSSLQVDPASKLSGMRSGLSTWHAYGACLSFSWRSSSLLLSHEALTIHRGWLPVRPRLAISARWLPKSAVTIHHCSKSSFFPIHVEIFTSVHLWKPISTHITRRPKYELSPVTTALPSLGLTWPTKRLDQQAENRFTLASASQPEYLYTPRLPSRVL